MQLQKELDVESDALDDNYTPYQIEFPLDAGCRKKMVGGNGQSLCQFIMVASFFL